MQTNFETFLTVDKFVADLKSQNLPPYPNSSITLDLPPLSSLQSSTTSKSSSNDAFKEAPSVDELTNKLLSLVTCEEEKPRTSLTRSSPISTEERAQTFEEKLDHLRSIYPAHKVSRLKAALEEANGDVTYASALVCESISDGCEFESRLECDESEVIESNSIVMKAPWQEVAKYIIDNHPSTELIGIPMEKFNDWEPEEDLLKQIRSSLLKHSCRDKSSSKKQSKKNAEGGFSARYANDLPKSNVEEDLALQKAVNDSIKPFNEVFHDPEVQSNLRELERAYPSVSREAIKEVIVRCEFDMDRAKVCLDFNLLDAKSFQEATDTTLALANLQYEELRAARIETNKRSYANKASLSTLAREFPSFSEPFLEQLLQYYGSAEGVRSYLETQGHYRQQGSSSSTEIVQLNDATERPEFFPYTPEEAQSVLAAQEKELSRLVTLKRNQAHGFNVARGEAKAYYASLLKRTKHEVRFQEELIAGLLVSIYSQKHLEEALSKESRFQDDPAWRIRTWFSCLNLHKASRTGALNALRQRLSICKRGQVLPFTPLPSDLTVPLDVALNGQFTLEPKYRPRKLVIIPGIGGGVLQNAVIRQLMDEGIGYCMRHPGLLELEFN
nr:NEDD4 binding protein 2 1 [Hymenolepis microstoma]